VAGRARAAGHAAGPSAGVVYAVGPHGDVAPPVQQDLVQQGGQGRVAVATQAALKRVVEDDWRRAHLQALVARFRAGATHLGLDLCDSPTPIQPLIVGESARAMRLSEALRGEGILVTAIRPPTVPEGTARLRITFSASHTQVQVDRLLGALEKVRAA